MDVKNNLNLVTYCNARTEDVIKLLRTCDDQDDDFSARSDRLGQLPPAILAAQVSVGQNDAHYVTALHVQLEL